MDNNIKVNINKLHGILLEKYENISIDKKDTHQYGKYFEMTINGDLELKIILPYNELMSDNFNWLYYSNPIEENSFKVNRKSNFDSILEDVNDIIQNKRFDKSYLK